MHVPAAVLALLTSVTLAQPSVKALSATVVPGPAAATATALVVVENGTMYDVYLVGAAADVAEAVEIREMPKGSGAPTALKEVAVPAFGQLEMSAQGVHLALTKLKRSLATGESIPLTLLTDTGLVLTVQAVVK